MIHKPDETNISETEVYSTGLSYCDSVQILNYKVNNSRNNTIYCFCSSKKPLIKNFELDAYKDDFQTFVSAPEGSSLTFSVPPPAEGINSRLCAPKTL